MANRAVRAARSLACACALFETVVLLAAPRPLSLPEAAFAAATLAVLARATMLWRPRGAARAYKKVVWALLVVVFLEPLAELWLEGVVAPGAAICAVAVIGGAFAGWRTGRQAERPSRTRLHWRDWWLYVALLATGHGRRRRGARPGGKGLFDWDDYVMLVVWLVAGQATLALLHAGLAGSSVAQQVAGWPMLSRVGAEERAFEYIAFFGLSQVAIRPASKSLAYCLRDDWRVVEGRPERRFALLALGGLPVVLCLLPAVHYGALVTSVLVRLGVLVYAWVCTRHSPAHQDAEFLAWGTRRAIMHALHGLWRLPRAGVRRDPTPGRPRARRAPHPPAASRSTGRDRAGMGSGLRGSSIAALADSTSEDCAGAAVRASPSAGS